jgi:hypothetical protein
MTILLRAIGGLAALLIALVLVGFVLPGSFRVERTVLVQSSAEKVFVQVADLRNWPAWGVWFDRDPGMTKTYSARTAGVGANVAWESKSEGNGSVEVTVHEPPSHVEYTLRFPDFDMSSRGSFLIKPAAGGVEVTWRDEGELARNPIHRWMGLFMDRLVGPDFEAGLAKLKQVVEKTP